MEEHCSLETGMQNPFSKSVEMNMVPKMFVCLMFSSWRTTREQQKVREAGRCVSLHSKMLALRLKSKSLLMSTLVCLPVCLPVCSLCVSGSSEIPAVLHQPPNRTGQLLSRSSASPVLIDKSQFSFSHFFFCAQLFRFFS